MYMNREKQQAEGKRHFKVKKANSKPSSKDKDHTKTCKAFFWQASLSNTL